MEQGDGHVITIAQIGHFQPLQAALMLTDRLEIGQDLAGMHQVGQAIDDRDRTVPGQVEDILMGKGPDHDAIEIAGHDLRSVCDRFAAAELDVLAGQEQGVATELVHADFKGNPGPGGGFGKDQAQGLALEDGMGPPGFDIGLELVGQVEKTEDFDRGWGRSKLMK